MQNTLGDNVKIQFFITCVIYDTFMVWMSKCEQRLRWCQLKAVLNVQKIKFEINTIKLNLKMNYIGSFKICQRMLGLIFATSYFIV